MGKRELLSKGMLTKTDGFGITMKKKFRRGILDWGIVVVVSRNGIESEVELLLLEPRTIEISEVKAELKLTCCNDEAAVVEIG